MSAGPVPRKMFDKAFYFRLYNLRDRQPRALEVCLCSQKPIFTVGPVEARSSWGHLDRKTPLKLTERC